MATIQVRDIPEQAYEVIRRRARAEGQSIQAYMRDRVVELTSRPSKREAMAAVAAALAAQPPGRLDVEEIVEHVHAERR
jgi:plasmid stability protein